MKTFFALPLLVSLLSPTVFALPKVVSQASSSSSSRTTRTPRWDRHLSRLYAEADLNRDGTLSFDECYERVLLFYIKLNRQAPIPPPTRAAVHRLYDEADWNHSRSLGESEFKDLASRLLSRGATRLLAHKLVTVLVAPFLATTTVRYLATSDRTAGARSVLAKAAETHLPERLARMVRSVGFWTAVFLVLTVSQLGNAVLGAVNWCLDRKKQTR